MRKLLSGLLPLMAAAIAAGCMTACSSDDDENTNDNGNGAQESGVTPQGPATTYNGKLLSRTGDMNFTYDSKGRCIEVRLDDESDGFIYVDYDNLTMTMEDEVYNVRFNSSGYITEISMNYNESYEGYTVRMDGKITFNYDGSGHMTGGTNSATATASGYGESYSETESSSAKYTWSGNLLTTVYCEEESKEDGEVTNSEITTFEITYSDMDNKYCQWTHAAEDYTLAGDCVGFVGMFGKASAKLPASYAKSKVDNGQTYGPTTTNVTYTLNSDGTISTEKVGYNTYTYSYLSSGNGDESEAKAHSLSRSAGDAAMVKSFKSLLNMEEMQSRLKARISKK